MEIKEEKSDILTADEAAGYLRIALSTLYRYMQEGRIPCFKVGKSWRFKRSVLDRWIEKMVSNKEVRGMEGREHLSRGRADITLGGMFRGLGSLIDLVSELAEKAEKLKGEVRKEGEVRPFGPKGLRAVYGFSIRVAGEGRPTIQPFGNVREEKGKGAVVDEVREPMADLFDEGDHFLVVVELPGVEESAARYEVKGDVLIVSAESGERKYYKEMLLPAPVDSQKVAASCKNGILELKLWRPEKY